MLVATAMTWPLIIHIGVDLPGDMGDSLLNCWIIAWDADRFLRFLGGDLRALAHFWDANIFHPEPLALAYSEHLTAQAIQILPVWALTRNVILCYNLLFLSTFVLSALGAFLLVRELTGDSRAGLVAGLVYGFLPYRVAQFPHLQVLSSQWMPFVLYALRRYFVTRHRGALAAAALALLAQHLSCGYYLVYFAPFVAAYVLFEAADRGRLRETRLWLELSVTVLLVALATWPFLSPYLALRTAGQPPRSFGEVDFFSADVLSYFTAQDRLRLWGQTLQAFHKPEGELFFGVVPLIFGATGLAAHASTLWRHLRHEPRDPSWRARLAVVIALVAGLYLLLAVVVLFYGPIIVPVGFSVLRASRLPRLLGVAALATGVLVLLSPTARRFGRGIPGSAVGFYAAAALAAWLFSLGPVIKQNGHPLATGPYLLLYKYVPGFDGLRVPARFGMLAMLCATVLVGVGAERIARRRAWGGAVLLLISLVFLLEATAVPIPLSPTVHIPEYVDPPRRVATGGRIPAVYQVVKTLPRDAVLAEFPFGAEMYEVRYMFYATEHWRPLVNGYSGGWPVSYIRRAAALSQPVRAPGAAWQALLGAGATHAIVHGAAYRGGDDAVSRWLLGSGARLLGMFGRDRLFELPRATP